MEAFEKYCSNFSQEVSQRLHQLRKLVLENVPQAVESISYGMPAYKLHGKPLVYFGAFKMHIGVYGTPTVHEEFSQDLAPYKSGKGSVQFKNDQPLPVDLIKRMILFHAKKLSS